MRFSFLFTILLLTTANAQEKAANATIEHIVTLNKKMMSTSEKIVKVKINKIEAIQRVGNLDFSYISSYEKLDLFDAYNLKSDGRKIKVLPDKILTKTGVTIDNVSNSDNVSKTAYLSDIEIGDTLVLHTKTTEITPALQGVISKSHYFSRNLFHDDLTYKYIYPTSLKLKFQEHLLERNEKIDGENIIITFTDKNRTQAPTEKFSLDTNEFKPSLFVSSLSSYEELGKIYEKAIGHTIFVSSDIKSLAEKITNGAKSDKEKADAIYLWMQKNIRYVALYLGTGRIIANKPDQILKNRFGDCKDMSTLLSSLLKAVNIESELVLINGSSNYSLPETPALFAAFNHMVVYIPSLGIYADATSKAATLDNMPFELYNKQALHIAGEKTRLITTPSVSPKNHAAKVKIALIIDENGDSKGTTEISGKGVYAQMLKNRSQVAEASSAQSVADSIMKASGYVNKATITLPLPYDQSETLVANSTYSVSYKVTEKKFVRLNDGISPFYRPYFELPEKKEGRLTPFKCKSFAYEESFEITIPAGKKYYDSPKNVEITNKYFDYSSSYRVEENKLLANRKYFPKFETPNCEAKIAAEIYEPLMKMKADFRKGFRFE